MLLARATAQKPTLMTASLVDFLASPKNRAKQQMTWSVGYQKRGHVSGWARRRGKTDPKDREAVWTVSNVRVESEVVMWSRLVEARHSRGRLAAAPHLNGRLAQLLGVGDEYAARIKLRLEV
jgi:hypothetical protein